MLTFRNGSGRGSRPATTRPLLRQIGRATSLAEPAQPSPGPPPHVAWQFLPALLALLSFLWFLRLIEPVAAGTPPEWVVPWVPSLGIAFAFRVDGLALAFALLITGIGAMCLLYAGAYFKTDRRLPSLQITLMLFAISMLGLVTADDVITLFVFWEGTTITSFLLVGFDHEQQKARWAALQALLVTGMGGLGLLAALLVMGNIAGTFRLSEINAAGDLFRASTAYLPVFLLVVFGAFTKSAQWPFQFWLPGAMAAPTPVSAYLHSATMVKAGVYLLARMTPSLGGTPEWFWTLTVFGAVTMVLASVWALRMTDLKMMLAYTTVMALGALVMLIGQGTPMAITAAMTFILVHAFYKAGLFLGVGMIDKGAGTREYLQVGGLRRAMPLTATVIAVASLSMAGIAPLFGFIGKELIYESLESSPTPYFVGAMAIAANALMVACAGMVAIRPFWIGPERAPKASPADPGWGLWTGPVLLAALGLAAGILPAFFEHSLVEPMVASVTGDEIAMHLALWHGLGFALWLSLVTLAIGVLLYLGLDRLRDGLIRVEPRLPRTEGWYDAAFAGTLALARGMTGRVQNGLMTSYLRLTFLALGVLIWGAILLGTGGGWPGLPRQLELIDWAIVVLVVASVGVVLVTESRLTAIAALGGVGTGIAMVFVLYGAIDVAMTQLFVEILIVVFLAIAMVRLPSYGAVPFRVRNAVVAVFLGLGVSATALSVLGTDLDRRLTTYFEETSYAVAHGRNIVNVILVDFRGFDTMGEIAVIVFAGVASVAALMAGRRALR
jgi:multicomponent Na+:H+ antiporter subunit A